jgi:adenosylcobinamide-phosphate synthase
MKLSRNWQALVADRAAILVLAWVIDLVLGEPSDALHPVVWLGRSIDVLERRAPESESSSSLWYGAMCAAGMASSAATIAFLCSRVVSIGPKWLQILMLACLLKTAFSVRGLRAAGAAVEHDLERDDLAAARRSLQSLVGRDRADLTPEDCASATVESLAENTTDSFIGPWLAYIAFGLPGAWLFRTVNTFDSRWGYHGRFEKLGKVPARLDDLMAWVPARISAALIAISACVTGLHTRGAIRVLWEERARTSSPNAGWTMATMAGALGCRLQKPGQYTLNSRARACTLDDIPKAQRVVLSCQLLFLAVISLTGLALNCRRVSLRGSNQ